MVEDGRERGEASGGRRPDPHAVPCALREALPTNRHAELLFDATSHLLADAGLVETAADGRVRVLYRRTAPDGARLFPWPLLTLSYVPHGRLEGLSLGAPVEAPHRPEVAPKLRGLKAGHVVLHDGAHSVEVTYRDDGLWKETVRSGPPSALDGVLLALERIDAAAPEAVADYMVEIDVARHGPGRLDLPVVLPDGPAGLWRLGLRALRRALHDRFVPDEPGWLVTDGLAGTTCVHGTDEAAALAAWREAVAEKRPARRLPPPPASSMDLGMEPWSSEARKYDEAIDEMRRRRRPEWPEPTPENTPGVIVGLEPCTLPAHAWGPWMRALGPHGESWFALQRFRPDGFTLVGQDVVDLVDFDTLEADLDAVDAQMPTSPFAEGEAWKGEENPYPCVTVTYRVTPGDAGAPTSLSFAASSSSAAFEAGTLLDGSRVRGHVIRQLWR
jgi:hypothetical protein